MNKKVYTCLSIVALILLLCSPASAEETSDTLEPGVQSWYTPQQLSERTTTITFELDSTWHTVHGKVKKVSGKVSLKDPKDPHSIMVDATMPVASFDTDSNMRDSKMRTVMDAETYPNVRFQTTKPLKSCTPALVLRDGTCKDELKSTITILNVSKDITMPITITKQKDAFVVNGSVSLRWAEYGVEDPSILIASVDPVVTISFTTTLSK